VVNAKFTLTACDSLGKFRADKLSKIYTNIIFLAKSAVSAKVFSGVLRQKFRQ
jgi:hypothetical protein